VSRVGRDYAYRKARAQVLKTAQSCAICGEPLDFDAPPRSSRSPSVDHVLAVSRTVGVSEATRQHIATDLRNLRAVHYGCNSRRGAGRQRRRHTSRRWD
jgi:hypothetical protein